MAPGTLFEGKYKILEEIGRGGMGVVYRGHDVSLDRMVAVKVLPEHFNTDEQVIQRFKKEARAMASLDHPNIVPVYAIGQYRNFHYFAMKFLSGRTVADVLEEMRQDGRGRFQPVDAQHVLMSICGGLAHAHARGLIHRDIKPGNIMIGDDNAVTIMDFGIVKEEKGEENLTRTGLVFGTPEYMAPEQAQGHTPPSPATDIYSVGVVAYEMISGIPPFRGDTPFSVVIKHIKEPPPPLLEQLPELASEFEAVIFRALEKRPEWRWPTAEAMREALSRVEVSRASLAPAAPALQHKHEEGSDDEQGRRKLHLPPPALLPLGLPPPPPRRPAPLFSTTPAIGEVNSSPLPGQIPARARDIKTPEGPPVQGRPLMPVATMRPMPRGAGLDSTATAAIVDDRPGHYRSLTTAQKPVRRTGQGRLVAWIVLGVLAVTGVVLIVSSLSREPASASSKPEGTPAGGEVKIAAPSTTTPEVQPAPPPATELEEVRVTLVSRPERASIFAADGTTLLGPTPHFIRRPRDAQPIFILLRKEGHEERRVEVKFGSDDIMSIELKPLVPVSP